MPVPGTVTPIPFFIRLAETLASMRSGAPPRWRAAMAEARASEIAQCAAKCGGDLVLDGFEELRPELALVVHGKKEGEGLNMATGA